MHTYSRRVTTILFTMSAVMRREAASRWEAKHAPQREAQCPLTLRHMQLALLGLAYCSEPSPVAE